MLEFLRYIVEDRYLMGGRSLVLFIVVGRTQCSIERCWPVPVNRILKI